MWYFQGVSFDEFLEQNGPTMQTVPDVLDIAMMLEAQTHPAVLGRLMDRKVWTNGNLVKDNKCYRKEKEVRK